MKNLIATFCFLFLGFALFAQAEQPQVVTQDTTVLLKVGEQMTPTSSAALNVELQRMEDNFGTLQEERALIDKELALIERRRQLVQAQQQLMTQYRNYSDLRSKVAQAEAAIQKPRE